MKRTILWMVIIITCLSLVSVFTLAGCKEEARAKEEVAAEEEAVAAEEEAVAAEEEEEFTKEVTLSVSHPWHGADAHAPFIEWAFADFQEKYPNIKIDNNEIPGESFRDKVRSDFMGDVATDIVLWYGGAEAYDFVREDMFLDLTEVIKPMEDQFMFQTLVNVSFDGKTYGLPTSQNFFAFYLNKDIYAKYGFEYPKTYEELKEQVKQFKEDGLIPIMLPGANFGVVQHFYSYIANQVTDAGDFEAASYAEEGKSYDDPGFVKAAEIIAELYTLGAFDPEVDATPMPSVEALFAEEEGAMYWAGIWRVGSLPDEVREKMQPILFPEVEGFAENANVATVQTEMAWFVNKSIEEDPDKLEAVKIFLKYFGSNEVAKKHLDLTDTIIPVNKDLDLSNASNAVRESVKLVENAELRPFLRYYQSPAQGSATNEMTWNLVNGRGTVEDNLKLLLDISPNKR